MNSLHPDKRISQQIWTDFTAHFKSKTTIDSYYSDLRECIEYLQKDFVQINSDDVQAHFEWLMHRVEKGEIKPGTMAKKFRECHSLAEYICDNRDRYHISDKYQDFYYPYLKQVAKQEKYARFIPIDDIDKLLNAAQADIQAYLIFVLLYRIGLSSTEIIEIQSNDIEEYADGVYVWVKSRREACFLPEDVAGVLVQYLQQRSENTYLFYNRYERPLNTMFISRMMKKYTALAGIPAYSAEMLRNSCAFTMYAYGAKDKQVAKQLGITRVQIKRYSDIRYKDNIQKQAQNLVKLKVEPPR